MYTLRVKLYFTFRGAQATETFKVHVSLIDTSSERATQVETKEPYLATSAVSYRVQWPS